MDVVPFCALQASVSYETGGWEGVSGTLWTIRACVYLLPAHIPTHPAATHPATLLRSLHTYVRLTHTFASLTYAAGRETGP